MELFIRLLECIQDRVAGIPRASSSSSLVAKLYLTLATPWTIACQASLSMGFSRQEYWSGLPFQKRKNQSEAKVSPLKFMWEGVAQRYEHQEVRITEGTYSYNKAK